MRLWPIIAGALVTLLVAGCFPFGVYDEELDGPYRLVAIDTMDEMAICWAIPDGDGDCVGEGLPAEKVIAAGADARFLVAARRPHLEPFGAEPRLASKVEYYYVVRTADEAAHPPPSNNIIGPLTRTQFTDAKRRLNLPEFSRSFGTLD